VIDESRLLAKMKRLPALPGALWQLRKAIGDPNSGAAELERAVKPDPALTTNLLRMANSPFFGCNREITSVRQAITLMGSRRVYEAAMGGAFSALIPKRLPGYEMDAGAFWVHCNAVAILGERLARELAAQTEPSLIFTAGLLHDVGKLAIGTFLADASDEALRRIRDHQLSLIDAERSVLGTDHSEIGARLAERWQLPQQIATVARWHHSPTTSEAVGGPDGPMLQRLLDIVHTADALAHSLGYGSDVGELARQVDPNAAARLALTEEQIEIVASASLGQVEQVAESWNTMGH